MEMVGIALVAFVLGLVAGVVLVGFPAADDDLRDLAVELADEIENRQGYRKAHPEARQ